MRNLKKLLALVLAMVMAFSLMLTANAAVKYDDYQDKDSITDEFTEAVQVLTGLEVMQGDEKGFRPSDKITRAEAAAVIYRAVTGDVTDRQTALYKDYGTFTDVKSDDWFAGYVGYCQNAGYIKGTSPTTFQPYGQVTGYEVLAMILRAVGYGKNNEFTGGSWQVNVASLARQLGVTRNVTAAHMEQTLNMAAPREVVADLIFMTIATVPTVTYTPALAYNDKQSVAGSDSTIFNITLGQQVFGLFHDAAWQVVDDWGNPGYRWRNNGAWDGDRVTTIKGGKGYMIPTNHPWYEATANTKTVATIKQAADYETTEQVRECDVAAAVDFDGEKTFRLYVNQKTSLTDTYRVVATDTVTRVGGQGRLTKVYYEMENPWFTDNEDNHDKVVTMVDTMLALVTSKTDAKLDAAGHVITPAQLEVTIYDGMNTTQNPGANGVNALSNRVITKGSGDKDNWDEYSKGDYILLNAYTNKTQNAAGFTAPSTAAVAILGNNTVRNTQTLLEEAAFTTNKVVTGTLRAGKFNNQDANVWVLQKADSIQGKQTVTSWNTGKHTVDGKEYNDQICLFLDRAGRVTNTTFTWFFDQYGNLIGIGDAHAVNYGVITSIYSAQRQGESDTTGAVKAVATVRYADGTTGTVEIDRFLVGEDTTTPLPTVAPGTNNVGTNTYRSTPGTAIDTATTGTSLELRPVFDNGTFTAMSSAVPNPTFAPTTGITAPGWIYMSASTNTNTNAHFATGIGATDAFGILYNNLFRFTVANDDAVVATEVVGSYTNGGGAVGTYGNTNRHFQDMANDEAVANDKLFKTLGYMLIDGKYVYLSSDAMIMVKLGDNSRARTINCYNGLSELPGDVNFVTGAEVDWTDTDGDGRADVVYIANGSMPSTVTYGLFYYNGGTASWNSDNIGSITGYLNGEEKTIGFTGAGSRNMYDTIVNSRNYSAHLFALQFTNDIVSNVMVAENSSQTAGAGTNVSPFILANEVAPLNSNVSGITLDFDSTRPATTDNRANNIQLSGTAWDAAEAIKDQHFGLGAAFGNPYTETTEAVYYTDMAGTEVPTAANGVSHVFYQRVSNGHRIEVSYWDAASGAVANVSYYLAPNCKIIGELDWLNIGNLQCDVTMVYDTTAANAVTEIYIARDPDITPVNPVASISGVGAFTTTSLAETNALLSSGAAGRVVYSPDFNDTGALNLLGTSNPQDALYFTFMCPAPAPVCTLTITNASGTIVYSETSTPSGTGARYFVMNFANPAMNIAGSYTIPGGLTAGTYNYSIVTGTTTLSSGSFTLG